MPADKVDNIQMFVLGERDMPLSPQVRLRGPVVHPLGEIVAEARSRMPDIGYDDVLHLALFIGLGQLPRIFGAGGRVERGGKLSFTPLKEGRKAAQHAVARAKLTEAGVLANVLLGEREPFEAATPQGPKDTIPNPQDPPQLTPPAA